MDRPNFIVLGAAKSGTTVLHNLLGQHPDVLMSHPKETHFFDTNYDKGLDAYWRDHFSRWAGQRAVGETTPAYLHLPFVARRIRRDLPQAKLIVSLRNPVDRAHSSWWMAYTFGRERRAFEVAILEELVRMRAGVTFDGPDGGKCLWRAHWLARQRGEPGLRIDLSGGHYAEQLRVYLDLFPRENLKVVLFEDLVGHPQGVTSDLWAFLGVDPAVRLADPAPRNLARGAWTVALYRLPFIRRVAARLPRGMRGRFRRFLDRVRPPRTRSLMDSATRRMLVEYYGDRNRTLEGLLGRDLSQWDA